MSNSNSLRLILIDQLSLSITSLKNIAPGDLILFCELMEEATNIPHHPKKLAFQFSAMRHFAYNLQSKGHSIKYVTLDSPDNSGNLTGEVKRVLLDTGYKRVIVTHPSEYRLLKTIESWREYFGVELNILDDDRFLCSIDEFNQFASGRNQLRMEYFYREMRKKYLILMEADGTPSGGSWNYDKENRKLPPLKHKPVNRISHKKDKTTLEVIKLIGDKFAKHFGSLEPFYYAVTREQALVELKDFIENILPNFGDYQDVMIKGDAYIYHSLLSTYINAGLLLPIEIIEMAEESYRKGYTKINSAEGFIRQILGWREFIRGVYWFKMPSYAELNYFETANDLPSFYWNAKTNMACIAEAVSHTRDHAYSHHIQRLMITGNFAMLAGLDVKQVQEWYLAVYSDAYEWVEMPNTLGMALFGDGGIVSSKPYAASGKYINKMSNYCKGCKYDPNEILADNACPFNALYWNFMARNRGKLEKNHRLPFVYATWDKFGTNKQLAINNKAKTTLSDMMQQIL